MGFLFIILSHYSFLNLKGFVIKYQEKNKKKTVLSLTQVISLNKFKQKNK